MQEALVMLVDAEYSGITINGDTYEYLALLKVMRKITAAPIGVSVSRYSQEENNAAIKNGAYICRARYNTDKNRVAKMSFDAVSIVRVLVFGVLWTEFYGFISQRILKSRDVRV